MTHQRSLGADAPDLASSEADRASLHAQLTSQMLTLQGQLATDESQSQSQTAAERERAEGQLINAHIVSMLEQAERYVIQRALESCGGDVVAAAVKLGMSRSALYRRLGKIRE